MPEVTQNAKRLDAGTLVIVELVQALWNSRGLIIGGTVLCALAAAVMTLLMGNVYESSATLLLMPPPYKERGPDARVDKADPVGLFPKLLTATDYAVLLKDDAVLMRVVERLRTEKSYPAADLDKIAKPSVLRKQLAVETRVTEKTATRTEYSPVIKLNARGRTPKLATSLAQAWADVAVESAAEFYKREGAGLSEFFSQRFGKVKSEYEGILEQQRAVEASWDESSARERLIEKAILLTKLEDDKARAYADLQSTRKEVEELATRLAQEKASMTLWKSPPTTALFLENDGKQPEADAEGRKRGYFEEVINETYSYVAQELSQKQAALKGLEERDRSLSESIEKTNAEYTRLREETAQNNCKMKAIRRQSDAYGRNLDLVIDKLRQAEVAESEQQNLVDLKLVANAVEPDRKVAPMRTMIVLSAAVVGAVLTCLAAFVRFSLTRVQL